MEAVPVVMIVLSKSLCKGTLKDLEEFIRNKYKFTVVNMTNTFV